MNEWCIAIAKAIVMLSVLMTIAGYVVLAERKIAAWMQGRVGPNRVSLPLLGSLPLVGSLLRNLGIFQPLVDGLKFLFKEEWVPPYAHKPYYILAPILAAVPALSVMAIVPFGVFFQDGEAMPLILADVEVGILGVFALSALGVYGVVLAGWASASKYPLLGSIRASAQMISYELALSLSVLPVLLWSNFPNSEAGLSLFGIVQSQESLWLGFWMPVPAFIFLVSVFAETNRLPFDMAESETDLVGGFHTEYGAFKFALFFLSEYVHMVVGSAVFVLLFLGGWQFFPTFGVLDSVWANPWKDWGVWGGVASAMWFCIKVLGVVFVFIWVRWTLPRFRYDQVMSLGWKCLMPLALVCVAFYAFVIAFLEGAFGV